VPARAYLDHASTSPARPQVVEAMVPWLGGGGDPGRVHSEGRAARAAVEGAREQVAALLGVRPRAVVFTSGATEAVNAAVWGATRDRPGAPVLCAAVEHAAVREASARAGAVEIGVDATGRIDLDDLERLLDRPGPDGPPALVHCQWGNHEVATLQPVAEVVEACRRRGVPVHVDAAAAAGHVPLALDDLGADLASVSAHKFGGPLGAGALVVRRGLRVDPLLVGGDQERARRAGTENVPAIVGFGAACEAVDVAAEAAAARRRTEAVLAAALAVPGCRPYGDTERRLPHLVCVGVDGVEAEAVLLGLDQAGVAAHSGSSCSSESLEPSPVLAAMGVDAARSLRVSVGWSTTDGDVAAFAAALPGVIARLRALAT
jgi:cysteine desulfurase